MILKIERSVPLNDRCNVKQSVMFSRTTEKAGRLTCFFHFLSELGD